MKDLQEEDNEKYQKQFSKYIAAGVSADDVEGMWTSIHAAIRKDPSFKATKKPENPVHKKYSKSKTNNKEKANRIKQMRANLASAQ